MQLLELGNALTNAEIKKYRHELNEILKEKTRTWAQKQGYLINYQKCQQRLNICENH